MRRSLLSLLLIAALHAGLAAQAFVPQRSGPNTAALDTVSLPFRLLTINDGLSQGMVTRVMQDRYGFMWFATKDGLDRYDGYGFKVYRNKATDSTTVAENYITSLAEDSKGRIWVGTATKGLDVFDRQREVFHHLRLGADGDASMVMNTEEDRDGNIWVATTKGLFKISFSPVADAATLPAYSVRRYFNRQCRIMQDAQGLIWGYLFSNCSFRFHPNASGADRMDTLDMRRLSAGPWNEDRNTNVNGFIIEDEKTGRVFGVYPYFIAEYDPVTAVPRIIHQVPYPGGNRLEADQAVIDANGIMWLGAGQLWRFDTRTLQMTLVHPRDPNLDGVLDNVIVSYQDRNGLVWAGTAGYGVLSYDPRVERFNTRPGASVRWLQPTIDGDVLSLSQRKFLSIFDPTTRTFIAESVDQGEEIKALFDKLIDDTEAVVQDEDGLLWLCKGDLFSLDPGTGKAERFRLADETGRLVPHRKSCFPLHQDGNTALWFGCDTAFYRFDKASHRFSRWRFPIVPVQYPYLFVQAIHQDAQGIFWIGTVKGLLRLDISTGAWKHFANNPDDPSSLSFDLIFSILPDPKEPDRYLWIGTNGGGLNRFDKSTGTCIRYTEKDGLPNDVVYGILSDAEGNLWMSTNKGLSRYSPGTNTFRNFTASDGLQSDEFNRNAFCKLKDGRLFFGGVNGFNHFLPSELKEDVRPVDVRITDIKLMNRSIAFEEDGAVLRAPSYLSEGMRIPHSANMVTFSFASMEYSAPEEHRYQYKLEGFDPDWIMSGNDNSAIYTNLDPGTYTFRVRGDNRDGIWDEQGTSFALVVLPPWWQTWWAYLGYMVIVVGSILLFIRLRTAGLKRQKEKLELTVAERTAELSHAKERAEKSELIKQQFLANMSHEIRTPMNAIMGMTGILRRNQHPPEQDKYLDAIAQSSDNLLVIINDILDLSKMEAGKIVLEQVPFDPREVIGNVRNMLHFNAETKGLTWTTQIEQGSPIALIGDPTRLQQILLNLTSNAIKFTEKGGITVRMSTSDHVHDRCTLRIDVSDSGIGIPADRVKRIFDEFTQAYSDTTRKYGGTGLGLSISKRLVELQGGTITVSSEQRKGSVFSISIPYVIASGASAPAAPANTVRSVKGLQDLRILLAEDNEFNAMVAKDELADAIPGVQVDHAENGKVALERARVGDYDLVLMDVQMPEMNGYDATRAIRALPDDRSRVPIIAMTANVMEAELKLCHEAGMTGHIPKPFSREELMNAIRSALVNDPSTT